MPGLFAGHGSLLAGLFGDGATVVVTPAGGTARTIEGVLRYREVEMSSVDGGVMSRLPVLTLAAQDADGLKDGDAVTVDGVAFTVRTPPRAYHPEALVDIVLEAL